MKIDIKTDGKKTIVQIGDEITLEVRKEEYPNLASRNNPPLPAMVPFPSTDGIVAHKPIRNKRVPGQSLGRVSNVVIKSSVLEDFKNQETREEKINCINRYYNLNQNSVKKYIYAYQNWIKRHPTVEKIAQQKQIEKIDPGKTLGKIGATRIKENVYKAFKEKPTESTLVKFLNLKPSSTKVYLYAYKRWLDIDKNDMNPKDVVQLKAKMVTLWREKTPITKSNLGEKLPELSSNKIGEILSLLIKNREVKFDPKKGEFELTWKN